MEKDFKELSVEQVAELSAEDQIKYFNDLNLFKAKQLEDFKTKLKTDTSEELKDQIKELKAEIAKDNLEQLKVINTSLEKQGLAITKLMAGEGKKEKKKSLKEILIANKEGIAKADVGSFKFRIDDVTKYVGKTTIGLSSITNDPMGMFLPEWAQVQSQQNAIAPSLNQFQLTPDDHGVIYWTDQTTRTNNAAARSDGDAAAEQVYAWTGYSETVDNISAMVPVHKEALKHITQMENEIKVLLQDDVAVALDGYSYTGSGTAPQIGGLYTRATAFDAAAYLAAGGYAYKDANLRDLIMANAAQIMKASKYNVDKVWLNPYDVLQLDGYKSDLGIYLPLVVNGMIKNIKVIEANSVTANTFVLGDSSKARLYTTGAAEIEIGYNLTGDFSKRILTVLANLEASLLIRNAEVDAFLKCTDIATDIEAIKQGA